MTNSTVSTDDFSNDVDKSSAIDLTDLSDAITRFCNTHSWLKWNLKRGSSEIALCYSVEGIINTSGDAADVHIVVLCFETRPALRVETEIHHPNVTKSGEITFPTLHEVEISSENLAEILIQIANLLTFNDYDLAPLPDEEQASWETWIQENERAIPTRPRLSSDRTRSKIRITVPRREGHSVAADRGAETPSTRLSQSTRVTSTEHSSEDIRSRIRLRSVPEEETVDESVNDVSDDLPLDHEEE